MEKKIKAMLKENEYTFPIGSKYGDLGDICTLWYELEKCLDLEFTVNVAGNDEQYLEAIWYSEDLKASVILDSGVLEEYENLEEIIKEVEKLNKKIEDIKARIK